MSETMLSEAAVEELNSSFINAVRESYANYNAHGARSNEKLRPLHQWVTDTMQNALGEEYTLQSLRKNRGGYEEKIFGKHYDKNVDICISKNDNTRRAIISVKFITSNFKQNANNYFQHLMGETANIRRSNIVVGHFMVLPHVIPYLNNKKEVAHCEIINTKHLQKYVKLIRDENHPHRPDAIGISVISLPIDDLADHGKIELMDLSQMCVNKEIKRCFITRIFSVIFHLQDEKLRGGKRMIGKDKEYGVVYTPEWIVDLILDNTVRKYEPGMKICDPSCGDGAFLVRLVERICDELPAKDCRNALENITGFDLDKGALDECRCRLDETLTTKGKRLKIKWNLHCMDTTDRISLAPYEERFDYVIGNPPYVRIQHLGEERRERLQRDWALARHGSTDLYIAFFEIGMFLLNRNGRLGYITPNTYTKTAAGKSLRKFILRKHAVACLIDFGAHQVFKDATTYSLITVLTKNRKIKKFALYRYDGRTTVNKGMVPVSCLSVEGIWILESEKTLGKIEEIRVRGQPLGEIADIHVGIQTLADSVFIMDKKKQESDTVLVRDIHDFDVRIETAITRPILKASVIKNGQDTKERIIIFPYISGKLIAEKYLMEQFPLAYKYLTKHKTELLARDKGRFDAVRWYAFGREFGLTTTFGNKLLTSGMNKKPNFQKCPYPEYTFYSGYCVKPKAGVDTDALLSTLNSSDMDFYIRHTSRDYQNGWKSYAKSFIKDYGIPLDVAGGCQPNPIQMSIY